MAFCGPIKETVDYTKFKVTAMNQNNYTMQNQQLQNQAKAADHSFNIYCCCYGCKSFASVQMPAAVKEYKTFQTQCVCPTCNLARGIGGVFVPEAKREGVITSDTYATDKQANDQKMKQKRVFHETSMAFVPKCMTCGVTAPPADTSFMSAQALAFDTSEWMTITFGSKRVCEASFLCTKCAPKAWLILREMDRPAQGQTNKRGW
jgi:hypothetical protein